VNDRLVRGISSPVAQALLLAVCLVCVAAPVLAHDVASGERAFLETLKGPQPFPYLYLGAKHMVTGYDHLLYLVGVVFFLFRPRDVLLYVSLFAAGHSITLIAGVVSGIGFDARLVDAVIGLSVVYKAIENLGGFRAMFRRWPDPRVAVFSFGLIHGVGLATKLQTIEVGKDGLLANLLAFNVGVEIGQLAALLLILTVRTVAQRTGLKVGVFWPNVLLMSAGFLLFTMHCYNFYLDL
jgi:hypothetical protein